MDIAQSCKSACNNQLHQSMELCHKEKHVSSMTGELTSAEQKLKATP